MKTVIRENTWLQRGESAFPGITMDYGWGNGYVLIPKGHSLHVVDYNNIHDLMSELYVNGGLTFSSLVTEEWDKEKWNLESTDIGAWCVGFDTCHYGDTSERWTKEAVQKETESLRDQLMNYKLK